MGIRTSVFFLALAPATLIAILLVTYLTGTRIKDLEQSRADRGQAIVNQLAPACEYGVLVNNIDILKKLARSVLKEADVSGVVIEDRNGAPLVEMSTPATSSEIPTLVFEAPIEIVAAKEGDTGSNTYASEPLKPPMETSVIGRVSVQLSPETLLQRQKEVIETSLLLTVLGLMLAAFLGQRIGRKVSDPILRLEHTVRSLRNGHLEAPIQHYSAGELGSLERGINAMALELKASHEHLREQVEEATAELQETMEELEIKNVELDIARKKALQTSRFKSEFLANMSHEIRTPMNGVMGFIALLSKTELKPTQRTYLQTLRASAENLMVILNDILDFSKIEAGKFKIRRRNFNLREALEDSVLLFAANAHDKGLGLILDIEPDVPSNLAGDAQRIAQIITNFVSNAVKFTDQGSVEVRVSKAQESARNVTLHLKIRDTGVGIALADQKRLFTAFDQVDTSTTRRYSGTGLGLAISQRLVSMMNGNICVESRPGEGTVFGVSLVVDKQEAPNTESRDKRIFSGPVIIVSDNTSLARAIAHILEYGGTRSLYAKNFEAAADCIQRLASDAANPRALILDHDIMGESPDPLISKIQAYGLRSQCMLIVLGGLEEYSDTEPFSQTFYPICFANKPPTSRELLPLLDQSSQSLPVLVQSADQISTAAGGAGLDSITRVKVLLADDNQINRQLARIFLGQLGTEVDEAHTGKEALELSEKHTYDLILMDIHMPEMDGLTATQRLRAQPRNPNKNTPVIALTADALARERNRYLDAGMNDHLSKPITESTLQQMLGKWCPGYSSQAPSIRLDQLRVNHEL